MSIAERHQRRSRTVVSIVAMTVILFGPGTALKAPGQGTKTDYQRSSNFDTRTRDKIYRAEVTPHWLLGDAAFWYRVTTGPDRFEFVFVDAETGQRRPAFDHEALAEALAAASGREVDAGNLPFRTIRLDLEDRTVRFSAFGTRWRCDPSTYGIEKDGEGDDDDESLPARRSPYPSRRTGVQTSLRFVNQTDGAVRLFWIDPSGERKPYGTLAPDEEREQHTFAGHVWLATDRIGRELAVFEAVDEPATAIIDEDLPERSEPRRRPARVRGISPDGRWRAEFHDHNVVIHDIEADTEFPLTDDGTEDDPYEGGLEWSPDSSKLVVMQVEQGEGRQVHLIDSAPEDQLQPKLITFDYAKPGDRIDHPRPRLFDVAARSRIAIDQELFAHPWSLTRLRWHPDSKRFTFLYNQRGHQVLRLIEVDAVTGDVRAIVEEQSDTFVDYANKLFLTQLDDPDELIWMSERDGWNHLYLLDAKTGAVTNPITSGEWVVRRVEWVDEENRQVWFRALGIHPDQDPCYEHLGRVNFDGSGLMILTEGDGTHRWEFSPDRRFHIDTYSRVDMPPVTELRRSDDGALVCELEQADWSALLETGWVPPERFVAKGRDGETDIHGIIVRPTNFDPERTYPVVEQIYAGPQGAFVPKAFDRLVGLYRMAELGFIMVQIDGMGTNWRSKAFHDVCWKNLGDAGFPDRIAWLKAAAAIHTEMDLDRVGLYGGSAGGQNALGGLLFHPEFYKVAVADCGCHDNRMDKIWWNELWMGYPVDESYAASSNVDNAHKLEGKLLLMVGELDRNVDPASTMQVVDALIRADKDFDLLVVPGAGHGAGGGAYGTRRRLDFFVRHLHGVEPRREASAPFR